MKKDKKYKGVYADKNNTYRVSASTKTIDGISIPISKRGFKSEKQAYDYKCVEINHIKKSYSYELKTNKTAFEVLWEEHMQRLQMNGLASSTLYGYNLSYNKHIKPFFKDKKMDSISNQDIISFKNYLSVLDIRAKTKNNIKSLLVSFFDDMALFNIIKTERFNDYRRLLPDFKMTNDIVGGCKGVYTKDDFAKFLDTFNQEKPKDKMYGLLFKTIFATGCRSGEIRALTASKIDFSNNTILFDEHVTDHDKKIKKGLKCGADKTVNIPSKLASELFNYIYTKKLKSDDLLFTVSTTPIRPNTLNERIKRHSALAGLKLIRPHDLRHSYITNSLDYGVDVKTVANAVGHSSTQMTTNVYNQITEKKKQKQNEFLEDLYS